MYLPLSWLREYVDISDVSVRELEKKLFSCGFEVEEITSFGEEIENCVVGVISSIKPHEDSDHLQICQVDCGEYGNPVQIVTGASNIQTGHHVPVALPGASLCGGKRIEKSILRGVESTGMLCSGEELGIDDDWYDGAGVNGILILSEQDSPGADVKAILGLDDYVLDISITANRPDCHSILGLAREVAAVLNKPLAEPDTKFHATSEETSLAVDVEAQDLCPRYIAHPVQNIKIAASPVVIRPD